jgi:hypothetical protein
MEACAAPSSHLRGGMQSRLKEAPSALPVHSPISKQRTLTPAQTPAPLPQCDRSKQFPAWLAHSYREPATSFRGCMAHRAAVRREKALAAFSAPFVHVLIFSFPLLGGRTLPLCCMPHLQLLSHVNDKHIYRQHAFKHTKQCMGPETAGPGPPRSASWAAACSCLSTNSPMTNSLPIEWRGTNSQQQLPRMLWCHITTPACVLRCACQGLACKSGRRHLGVSQ